MVNPARTEDGQELTALRNESRPALHAAYAVGAPTGCVCVCVVCVCVCCVCVCARACGQQMYPLLFGVFGLRALGCLGFWG